MGNPFDHDRVFVKICGITNADDALLAAGMGADAIGMIFAASSRRVTRRRATEIVRRLPAEVFCVGVFRDEARERVVELANSIGLKAVQLHGFESPEDTRWIADRVQGGVIRALPIESPMLGRIDDFGPARLLVDGPKPGAGETYDWSLLNRVPKHKDYILAGGLNPTNVLDAIHQVQPWGVDVASGVESQPGIKDTVKVHRFITAAKSVKLSELPEPPPLKPQLTEFHQQAQHQNQQQTNTASAGSRIFDWQEDTTWQ